MGLSRWEKSLYSTLPRWTRRTLAPGGVPQGAGTPRASGAGGPRGGEVRALNTGDEKYPPPASHPILSLRTGPAFTGVRSFQPAQNEFLSV